MSPKDNASDGISFDGRVVTTAQAIDVIRREGVKTPITTVDVNEPKSEKTRKRVRGWLDESYSPPGYDRDGITGFPPPVSNTWTSLGYSTSIRL